VRVNGEVPLLGARVVPGKDRLTVDDAPVDVSLKRVYYLHHKRLGVISSAHDDRGRPTVLDSVPTTERVYPVGRLDRLSEGLMIITNDGELANYLTHPRYQLEKEYLVTVRPGLSHKDLSPLRRGILDQGDLLRAHHVGLLDPETLRIVLREGKNHEIRRMCAHLGVEVIRLVRVRIGPIRDSTLASGSYRELTNDEVLALRHGGRWLA
jgi:23S rRNA pseudouridine2605 synthase